MAKIISSSLRFFLGIEKPRFGKSEADRQKTLIGASIARPCPFVCGKNLPEKTLLRQVGWRPMVAPTYSIGHECNFLTRCLASVKARFQLVEKVRFGLTPRRAFAFQAGKIATPKENPLKELLCVSSPERDFSSSISRWPVSLNSW